MLWGQRMDIVRTVVLLQVDTPLAYEEWTGQLSSSKIFYYVQNEGWALVLPPVLWLQVGLNPGQDAVRPCGTSACFMLPRGHLPLLSG